MLMVLGPIEFTVAPFNTHQYAKSASTDFARKAVVGTRAPLEHVGEGEENFTISGLLLPKRLGGMLQMAELHALRQSAVATFLMRGDGVPLGWFVVENVDEDSSMLSADGVGQVIKFKIDLCRADKPLASSFFTTLFSA